MRYGVRLLVLGIICWLLTPILLAQEAPQQATHVVQRGDTLFRIALRYGVTLDALAQANSIADPSRIKTGQVLVIPGLSVPDSSAAVTNPLVAATPTIHVVQRGETLGTIAKQYGVSVEQLLTANNLANPNRILAGQELKIWTNDTETAASAPAAEVAAPAAAPAPEVAATPAPSVAHTVQSGEFLSGIARRYGVSWTAIAEANNILDPNQIYAGMTLTIPDPSTVTGGTDLGIIAAAAADPGARVGVGREIVVDLSSQMTYAYENGILQRSALVSTGLPATPTVRGDYKIYRKLDSQAMSGPGYYLPGVQWVMYFYQGYAIHGTYWHNNFGQPMSHGCVNMTNDDAYWFYTFAEMNTPVHVQW